MSDYSDAMGVMRAVLRKDGIRGAVIHLNGLTEHRFTSLYRFEQDKLHSLYFYDREHPADLSTPAISALASYCVFVRDGAAPFAVADSLGDDRVSGHPKRLQVRSYCGVPLIGEDGRVFGTVCHFDLQPRALSPANFELLEAVASLLNERYADVLSGERVAP